MTANRKLTVTLFIDDLRSSINDVAEEGSEVDAERKLNATLHEILGRYVNSKDSIEVEVDIDSETVTLLPK